MFLNITLAQGLKQAGSIMGEIAKDAGAADYSKPQELIGTGINAALAMVGLIFLVLMIYAGYLWLTSHGEEEPIKKAQKIIVSSVIGFVLVVSAYAITVFVGKRFEVGGGGTTGDECTKAHSGWSCQLVAECKLSGDTYEAQYVNCTEANKCAKDLCPGEGAETQACCLGAGTENADGDPNLQVCCVICKESFADDWYDSPEDHSGVMSQAACLLGCTGEDAGECMIDTIQTNGNEEGNSEICEAGILEYNCEQYEK